MNVSNISKEVLANTKVAVTDENGTTSIAEKYDAATGVEIVSGDDEIMDGKLELTVGDLYIVGAMVKPSTASDKSIKWSSENPTIAIYDIGNGQIEALSPGTTTITASHGESLKASIIVTVKAAPVKDPSVNDPDDYSDGGDPTAASN